MLLTVFNFSLVLGKLFFVLKLDFLGDVLFVASLAHLRLESVSKLLELSIGLCDTIEFELDINKANDLDIDRDVFSNKSFDATIGNLVAL